MKVTTKLCKLSADLMTEIAKIPEDLDEEEVDIYYIMTVQASIDFAKERIRQIAIDAGKEIEDATYNGISEYF